MVAGVSAGVSLSVAGRWSRRGLVLSRLHPCLSLETEGATRAYFDVRPLRLRRASYWGRASARSLGEVEGERWQAEGPRRWRPRCRRVRCFNRWDPPASRSAAADD